MGISYQENEGLAVTAYAGDRTVLLAFDLPEEKIENLAGFAIVVSEPDSAPKKTGQYFLKNRLKFNEGVTSKTPYDAALWTQSDKAPFQSFHWAHYPSQGAGTYTYTIIAMYFAGAALKRGAAVNIAADLRPPTQGALEVGFTRTMISSQAYANKFSNKPLYPEPQTVDFNTAGYVSQYSWLGAHTWEMIMAFLDASRRDPKVTLDVFAFDLNEPEVIRGIAALGSRARVFQDNSVSHCSASTDVEGMQHDRGDKEAGFEPEAVRALRAAGVAVKTGHFGNLSHNKVMVRRRGGKAEAVLTGSANFTIRGLYVQANSVLVFENDDVAGLYAAAFN
jgi:hypothetical protein